MATADANGDCAGELEAERWRRRAEAVAGDGEPRRSNSPPRKEAMTATAATAGFARRRHLGSFLGVRAGRGV